MVRIEFTADDLGNQGLHDGTALDVSNLSAHDLRLLVKEPKSIGAQMLRHTIKHGVEDYL